VVKRSRIRRLHPSTGAGKTVTICDLKKLRSDSRGCLLITRLKMYAIIADGGRQYKVEEGQFLEIDFRDAQKNETLEFDRVLAISDGETIQLGRPTVEGARVSATVVDQTLGDKLYIQKLRRRKNSRRRTGHRQKYLKVQIGEISGLE